MKNLTKVWLVVVGAPLALVSSAYAAVPTDISGMVTDSTTVWGTIKTLKVEIFVFGVLLFIAAKIRGK